MLAWTGRLLILAGLALLAAGALHGQGAQGPLPDQLPANTAAPIADQGRTLFPLSARDIWGTAIVFIASAVASGAGLGGGPLYVPVFILIMGMPPDAGTSFFVFCFGSCVPLVRVVTDSCVSLCGSGCAQPSPSATPPLLPAAWPRSSWRCPRSTRCTRRGR